MNTANLISRAEAAKLAGMDRQTFHYYYMLNRVPGKKIIGGLPFFDKDVIEKWEPVDRRYGPRRK